MVNLCFDKVLKLTNGNAGAIHFVDVITKHFSPKRGTEIFDYFLEQKITGKKLSDFYHNEMNHSIVRFKNYLKEQKI